MAELGLGFVALGLIIALFIFFASWARGISGGVSGSERRGFLEGIVGLSAAGLIVAFVGSTAVDSLFDAENTLRVPTGGTYTLSGTECEVYSEIRLEDSASLRFEENSCITITDTA